MTIKKNKSKSPFNTNEHTPENKSENEGTIIKSNSDWEPKKICHTIWTSIKAVSSDIYATLQEKKIPINNLSNSDKNAI